MRDGEIIVDLFAGGGGASHAILLATGRHPDIAVNHDDDAVQVHAANHPGTIHHTASVWKVEPRTACAGRPVGLLWASPDCFPRGTLVTTPEGQTPIEEVREGDFVLTHKGRWRRVISTLTREAETVEVRGHGHYRLVTTPTHLFYSKRITRRWPGIDPETGKRPGKMWELVENPYWPAASDMERKLWATPRTFPALPIPICKGAEFSTGFFYLVGRWLGDGSLNKTDVEICCGAAEFGLSWTIFAKAPLRTAEGEVLLPREVDHGASKLIVWGNADLARWLAAHFGVGGEGKRVPTWCLAMQRDWREALLRGYVDADGHEGLLRVETKTVNKNLAISFRLLVTTLSRAASLYRQEGKPGETVWTDTLHQFSPVRTVKPAGVQTVVSLQVEEDESFVADGVVVHNCRHFSRAAGGRPRWKSVRSLPGVVLTWATRVQPRVIVVENVREFLGWGPLLDDGTPCPKRVGRSFNTWVGRLRGLGYRVQWRELNAADFGAPTTRTRLFVVARRDDASIVWPTPTHKRLGGLFEAQWRAAAECIDWTIPCPSIFARPRPLAEATLRRIAAGIERFVLRTAEPFITGCGGRASQSPPKGLSEPLNTITTKADQILVAPTLAQVGWGEREGQAPRALDIGAPLGTIVAGGNKHALVAAFLAQHNGGEVGHSPRRPLSTITAAGTQQQLVQATLSREDAAGAERVAAFLLKYYGSAVGQGLSAPLDTITTKDRFALVTVGGVPHAITDIGMRMLSVPELKACQGFPAGYVLDRGADGRPIGKTTQIRLIGNSVSPPVAAALLRANLVPRAVAATEAA